MESEQVIRKYLLGELPQNERQQVEERLLADDDYYQQLLIIEEDLIDAYVSRDLPPDEQARFDGHFLAAPERQQDLRFAKALRRYVDGSAAINMPSQAYTAPHRASLLSRLRDLLSTRKLIIGFAVAALLLLAIIAGSIRLLNSQSQPSPTVRTEPPQQQSEEQPAINNPPPDNTQTVIDRQGDSGRPERQQPAESPNPEKLKPTVFTIALVSGGTRDAGYGANRFKVPFGTGKVRLMLELNPGADDYPIYQAALETGSGRKVLSQGSLRPRKTSQGKIVLWEIDAKRFSPVDEDYYLRLSGRNPQGEFESAGVYSFKLMGN